jgi:hypothetical protein
MEKVFDEVVYPEELTLKKKDHVVVTVSDKTGHTFQPYQANIPHLVSHFKIDRRRNRVVCHFNND